VVNNAAMLNCKSLLDIEDDMIAKTFDVNILAHFWV
jgi:NAD(P)-dependent dehydrogenase (short-subunit alcohol dehydrogenase family)